MLNSGTTAGLRGVFSVDGAVAWVSGTGGTVLETSDGGEHWRKCAVPDAISDGATLDFRGVRAWDARTALVMASGPGTKSRLYKTVDGCKTWKLVFGNPDQDGFWDAFSASGDKISILGDPVAGREDRAAFGFLRVAIHAQKGRLIAIVGSFSLCRSLDVESRQASFRLREDCLVRQDGLAPRLSM
jgi:photosystem II stability/assembly factor-like uncharacterized protein